jgi:hypothetical protein
VVFATLLIVNDEWDDLMTQAFLQQDHSPESAVAVFEGMNTFKADMEIQNIFHLHFSRACDVFTRLFFSYSSIDFFRNPW